MKKIKCEKTWCDYLTPCPYSFKDKNNSQIMVGDFDCFGCKYQKFFDDANDVVECYKDEFDEKYNVILKDNNEEIREIMQIIGWKSFGSDYEKWLYTDLIANEFSSCDDEGLKNILKDPYEEKIKNIDCGNNIAMFLSIAALNINDKTDKYKIFVTNTSQHWINQGMWQPKGSLNFCLVDDYYLGEDKRFTSRITPSHLASTSELIEICRNENNCNAIKDFYYSLLKN